MKNTVTRMLFVLFAATVAFPGQAPASETGRAQTIIRNGEQAALKGSAQYFTGNVRIDPLYPANGDMRSSMGSVTFEPGARSHGHIHPVGQPRAGNPSRRRGALPR